MGKLLTMQLGPEHELLTVEIRFPRTLGVQQVENAISRIKKHIREKDPSVATIFIDPERFPTDRRDEHDAA